MLMLAFGLGTLPNLLLMGWGAARLRELTRQVWLRRLAGLVVAGLGVWGLIHLWPKRRKMAVPPFLSRFPLSPTGS
jgi:sulfite exporter TauE/SafE